MWTTIVNSLSQVANHPVSIPCWVDRAGPVLVYRTMHLNDVAPASCPMISLLDIILRSMIVLRTPGLSGRSSKQSSFGYSSTAVEGYKRCSGYGGCSVFTSSTTGQYLNNRCGSKHLIANSHAGLIERKEDMYRLFPMTAGFFLSRFLVLADPPELFCQNRKMQLQQQVAQV